LYSEHNNKHKLLIMKKNSLTPNKGLSLSQAQSISNLCYQKSIEITKKFESINNATKIVEIEGKGEVEIVKGRPIPSNVVDLIKEKAELHACQAFLMENIKAKDEMLLNAKNATVDLSGIEIPEPWVNEDPVILPPVNEDWGWEQLSVSEINEFIEAEAYAAHIGQFIHGGSVLNELREELPNIPDIEWMVIKDGEKSPVMIKIHHTSEQLLHIHEQLAELHRVYEQKVNYSKAKVKNLVTKENARIAKINADAQANAEKINKDRYEKYEVEYAKATEKMKTAKAKFEQERQRAIEEIASMRIEVDPRFVKTIDMFLGNSPGPGCV